MTFTINKKHHNALQMQFQQTLFGLIKINKILLGANKIEDEFVFVILLLLLLYTLTHFSL